MKLDQYLQSTSSNSELAKKLCVAPSMVSQWRTGARPIPERHCVSIERCTGGAVMRWDLRPGDWHLIWPELIEKPGSPDILDLTPKKDAAFSARFNLAAFVDNQIRLSTVTQREIAAGTGIPYATLTKIAQGTIKNPGIKHVQALADYFGWSAAVEAHFQRPRNERDEPGSLTEIDGSPGGCVPSAAAPDTAET